MICCNDKYCRLSSKTNEQMAKMAKAQAAQKAREDEIVSHVSTRRNSVTWDFTSQGGGNAGEGHYKSDDVIASNIFLDEFYRVPCFCLCCGCAENDGLGTCCGYSGKLCCCRSDARLGLPFFPGCTFLSLCPGMFAHARCPRIRELPPVICCGKKSLLRWRFPRRCPDWCQYCKCCSSSDEYSFMRDECCFFCCCRKPAVMQKGDEFWVAGDETWDGELAIEKGPRFETEAEIRADEKRHAEENEEKESSSSSEGS